MDTIIAMLMMEQNDCETTSTIDRLVPSPPLLRLTRWRFSRGFALLNRSTYPAKYHSGITTSTDNIESIECAVDLSRLPNYRRVERVFNYLTIGIYRAENVLLVETESRRAPHRKRKFIVIIDSRTAHTGLGWALCKVQGVNQRRRDSAVPA